MGAVGLGMAVAVMGPLAIEGLTDLASVRSEARTYLPYAAVYVMLSFPAFQLDGIFIGATATRAMRNASIASFAAFVALSLGLMPRYENLGLWLAFIVYVVARAVALGVAFAGLRRSVAEGG